MDDPLQEVDLCDSELATDGCTLPTTKRKSCQVCSRRMFRMQISDVSFSWTMDLYINPSHYTIRVCMVLFAAMLVLFSIILVLRWLEKVRSASRDDASHSSIEL